MYADRTVIEYLDCMEKAVTKVCGKKTGAWQRYVTTLIMRDADYDHYCVDIHPHEQRTGT